MNLGCLSIDDRDITYNPTVIVIYDLSHITM